MFASDTRRDCNVEQPLKCKDSQGVGYSEKQCEFLAPDGGWGWMVAIASFISACLVGAVGVHFSLILEDLIIAMNTTTATVSWIASTHFFTSMICVPLVSAVSLRYSFRKAVIIGGLIYFIALFSSTFVRRIELLIVTFGVFKGLASAFVTSPMIYAINEYFDTRRGLVTGIFMGGLSAGRFFGALILQVILNTYAFRNSLLIMAAISLNICACGGILQPVTWHLKPAKEKQLKKPIFNNPDEFPNEKNILMTDPLPRKGDEESVEPPALVSDVVNGSTTLVGKLKNKKTWWQKFCTTMRLDFTVMQNPCFYIVGVSNIINSCILPYVTSFLPSLALSKGYEPLKAAMLLSIMTFCDVFGRVFVPWIVDCKLLTARAVLMSSSFCYASLLLGLTLSTEYYADMVICGFGGFLSGGLSSTNLMAIANVLGPQKMPSVLAFTQFIQSFFALAMGPLLGMARDYTGNFEATFIIMSSVQYCTILVWLFEPFAKKRALQLNK